MNLAGRQPASEPPSRTIRSYPDMPADDMDRFRSVIADEAERMRPHR